MSQFHSYEKQKPRIRCASDLLGEMPTKDKGKEQDQEQPSDSGAGLTSEKGEKERRKVGQGCSTASKQKTAYKQSVTSGENYLTVVLSYGFGAAQESMGFT